MIGDGRNCLPKRCRLWVVITANVCHVGAERLTCDAFRGGKLAHPEIIAGRRGVSPAVAARPHWGRRSCSSTRTRSGVAPHVRSIARPTRRTAAAAAAAAAASNIPAMPPYSLPLSHSAQSPSRVTGPAAFVPSDDVSLNYKSSTCECPRAMSVDVVGILVDTTYLHLSSV